MFKKFLLSLKAIKNIAPLIFDYMGLIKKDIIYKLRNGTKIIARGGSTDAAEIIIINSGQEYPKKYFPKNYQAVIIDAGANIGAFSIYIAKKLFNNKPIIYSIEPSINNFSYLEKNIKLNNFINCINIYNLGFYNKNGVGYIDLQKKYDSYAVMDSADCANYEKVNLATLEDFCGKNKINKIDLLKMDIEGGEYCIFYDSIEFIKEHVGKIFIEVHYLDEEKNINNFIKFVKTNNFKIIDIIMNRTLILENNNKR